ncbi:hypothetical protein VNO77_10213 [Canavalia gladiata]|uniref:Uncharacterized protein n=1 Tax=Canavalia gladiata TaxID=3824 RepID=A0AAN9QX01_CANGL
MAATFMKPQLFGEGLYAVCALFLHLKMKHQAAEKKEIIEKPLAMPPPPPLERKTSIDAEPKTLLQEELSLAREAALKIINTHTKEEALKIFLTGLVPVASSKQAEEDGVASECDDE